MHPSPSTAKLSALQKWLLGILYADHLALAANPDPDAQSSFRVWGAPFRITNTSPAQQAGLSRALRRLEARGLVLRQSRFTAHHRRAIGARDSAADANGRTNYVKLLPDGVEAAKRLTSLETASS